MRLLLNEIITQCLKSNKNAKYALLFKDHKRLSNRFNRIWCLVVAIVFFSSKKVNG